MAAPDVRAVLLAAFPEAAASWSHTSTSASTLPWNMKPCREIWIFPMFSFTADKMPRSSWVASGPIFDVSSSSAFVSPWSSDAIFRLNIAAAELARENDIDSTISIRLATSVADSFFSRRPDSSKSLPKIRSNLSRAIDSATFIGMSLLARMLMMCSRK